MGSMTRSKNAVRPTSDTASNERAPVPKIPSLARKRVVSLVTRKISLPAGAVSSGAGIAAAGASVPLRSSSRALWQRTRCASSTGASVCAWRWHLGSIYAQRGAKAQPVRASNTPGTMPGMLASRAPRRPPSRTRRDFDERPHDLSFLCVRAMARGGAQCLATLLPVDTVDERLSLQPTLEVGAEHIHHILPNELRGM